MTLAQAQDWLASCVLLYSTAHIHFEYPVIRVSVDTEGQQAYQHIIDVKTAVDGAEVGLVAG